MSGSEKGPVLGGAKYREIKSLGTRVSATEIAYKHV